MPTKTVTKKRNQRSTLFKTGQQSFKDSRVEQTNKPNLGNYDSIQQHKRSKREPFHYFKQQQITLMFTNKMILVANTNLQMHRLNRQSHSPRLETNR